MYVRRREKNKAYIVTAVDRATHTIAAFAVCEERTLEIQQTVIDSAPRAANYYTDGFLMYQDLSYWGTHKTLKDKSETFSRHYLTS
jgi:IS1 family transposase